MTNDEQAFWLYISKKTKTYLLVICSFIKNFDKLCTRWPKTNEYTAHFLIIYNRKNWLRRITTVICQPPVIQIRQCRLTCPSIFSEVFDLLGGRPEHKFEIMFAFAVVRTWIDVVDVGPPRTVFFLTVFNRPTDSHTARHTKSTPCYFKYALYLILFEMDFVCIYCFIAHN